MKMRLDVALVARGLAPSRAKAQEAIARGEVTLNGVEATKPSQNVGDDDGLQVLAGGATLRFVSRGGLKLQAALDFFGLDARGQICLDIGASTGGFSDCLLQSGAARVVAIENGRGQIHPSLLTDKRLQSREQTDARGLRPEDFGQRFGLATLDVSFLSLRSVLPVLPPLLRAGASVVALVKPQFEVGPDALARGGIVRDESQREQALQQVLACARELGWNERGAIECPVAGGDGNREWLACWTT